MKNADIRATVINIIVERLGKTPPENSNINGDESLLDSWNLKGLDLFYLMLETQDTFGITVPYSQVLNNSFRTINSIVELVENCLSTKWQVGEQRNLEEPRQ